MSDNLFYGIIPVNVILDALKPKVGKKGYDVMVDQDDVIISYCGMAKRSLRIMTANSDEYYRARLEIEKNKWSNVLFKPKN